MALVSIQHLTLFLEVTEHKDSRLDCYKCLLDRENSNHRAQGRENSLAIAQDFWGVLRLWEPMQQWKQGPGHAELFAVLLHVPCFLGTCTVHFWLHYSADIALPPSGSHSLSSFSLSQRLHRSTSVHRNRRSGPTLVHATYDAHPPSSDLPHPDTHLFSFPSQHLSLALPSPNKDYCILY